MTEITLEKLLAGTVKTTDPTLTISMPDKKLNPGEHVLSLAVVDSGGNTSEKQLIKIVVVDRNPVAIIDMRNLDGAINQKKTTTFGQGFILDGKRSTDPDGQEIKQYIWTLEPQT